MEGGGDTAGKIKDEGNGKFYKSEKSLGSVKEAVALFEEKVHATSIDHVNRIQPISKSSTEVDYLTAKLEEVTLELQVTKQNLEECNKDREKLGKCVSILQTQLDDTKHELQELKEKDLYFRYKPISGPSDEDWVEKDVEHIEDVKQIEVKSESIMNDEKELEFLSCPVISKFVPDENHILERKSSLRTKKKKSLLEGFFSRRKGSKESSNLEESDDYGEQIVNVHSDLLAYMQGVL